MVVFQWSDRSCIDVRRAGGQNICVRQHTIWSRNTWSWKVNYFIPAREARRSPKLCLKNRTPNRSGGNYSESANFEVFHLGQNAF